MTGSVALAVVLARAGPAAADAPEPAASKLPVDRRPLVEQTIAKIDLEWNAPAACPGRERIDAALRDFVAESPAPEHPVRVVAKVTREKSGRYRLDLRIETDTGTSAHAATASCCETLADTVALAAAVAIDPSRTGTAPPVDTTLCPACAPCDACPKCRSCAKCKPVPTQPAPPRVRFGLRPSLGLDLGALPGVAAMGSLSFALFGKWWRAEVSGAAAGPRRASSSITAGAGGPVAMWAVGARGCGVPFVRRVEFPLCGGIEAGQQRGHGTGATVGPRRGASSWVAFVLGSQVAWAPRTRRGPASPVALFFGIDLVVPVMRSSFSIGTEEVHRAARAGMRALAGVEVRVP